MSIVERLDTDMKQAMRDRDQQKLGCIRMLKARLQEKAVALRTKGGVDAKLTDEDALEVVGAYAKQRRDSIDAYRQAGRDDLADKEEAELAIVTTYLPQQLDEAELRKIVAEAVAEAGASSAKDMGAVMKLVVPRTKGRADGKLVSSLVRDALSG